LQAGSTIDAPMVSEAIERLLDTGQEIGLQVCAYLNGQQVIDSWGGLADREMGRRVGADTLFNVFSVTKAVIATALHMQVDRGLVDYDARVADYWPEFGVNGKEATTVRHVLTHRAGIPQMPEEVTPESMCDWNWMISRISAMTPLAPPGEKALYLSMTFGWLVGEIVRRTDPARRMIGDFIRQEIAQPLNAPDLWVGLPASEFPRVAKLVNAGPFPGPGDLPPLYLASMPPQVDLIPEVFELPFVRSAAIAGVGGVFSARSCARFWAMLAQGGELDGVRLLSEDLVSTFNIERENNGEPDPVMYNAPVPLGIAGFWLGEDRPFCWAARHRRVLHHPGAGNSTGFADPETGLAFAFTHNRMSVPATRESDSALVLAEAVRRQLGVE
jgi:CubicO group peptidase (beta-lactamase class C family)